MKVNTYKLFLVSILTSLSALFFVAKSSAQAPLITNVQGRNVTALNGKWQYIVDPYETGFYDYRYKERRENDKEAYWNNFTPDKQRDHIEHDYTDKYALNVPGDWNSQDKMFLYYEGTVWYKKSFDYEKLKPGSRLFLYFGAVNYKADVYLNGHKLGTHLGGFTPFNFEIADSILKTKGNFLVVKADNKRYADEVPTLNTDWWNYGGITRNVELIEVPSGFIQDYFLQLNRHDSQRVSGWIKINEPGRTIVSASVEIPELKYKGNFKCQGEVCPISFKLPRFEAWAPEHPKRYDVTITAGKDKVAEKIGFRTVEVKGKQVLVNGKPVFMRGISIHEEIPQQGRRAYSAADARMLLGWAKELNCNMVRLAHYPHDETMTRLADSLGMMVWSEIPVYWTIDFKNPAVLNKAKAQLQEMITRDHNRASVLIWSVGNETPVSTARTDFMHALTETAHQLDSTRIISAALEVNYNKGKNIINDPLGQYTDMVAVNEYLGWYSGLPASCRTAVWETIYNKPLFFSETGAEALSGFHSDSTTVWSEEYQEWYYKEQVAMMKRMPDNFIGLSPWILADFRSPKRNHPEYQDGWNNKGLIDHRGRKKKAFYILQQYYADMKKKYGN